jgi:uncharacterized protein
LISRPAFNVAQLLRDPVGATRVGLVQVSLRDLVPELRATAAGDGGEAETLTGDVRLMHITGGILAQGTLRAEVSVPCSRCLDPVLVPLEVVVEETFVPTLDVLTGQTLQPEDEDRALWIDEHHILDLSEVLRQDVLVELPLHPLCRSDCRGLCPTCGQNLNAGNCDCADEPDARWSKLTDLLAESSDPTDSKE